jgi:uncharacterized protein YkwD
MTDCVVFGMGAKDSLVRGRPPLKPINYSIILAGLAALWFAAASMGDASAPWTHQTALLEAAADSHDSAAADSYDTLGDVRGRILSRYAYGRNAPGSDGKAMCLDAFEEVNRLRAEHGRMPLEWDDGLYRLAFHRSQDMDGRGYLDHVDPEGNCAQTLAAGFNISYAHLVDNVYGVFYNGTRDFDAYPSDAVEYWMASRGHRYNLLYEHHTAGAMACQGSKCTFIGANDYPGETVALGGGLVKFIEPLGGGGCFCAAEVEAFWADAPKQSGEI